MRLDYDDCPGGRKRNVAYSYEVVAAFAARAEGVPPSAEITFT